MGDTVFNNPDLFLLESFTFNIQTGKKTLDPKRGYAIAENKLITIKCKVKRSGGSSEQRNEGSLATESYKFNLVEPSVLPLEIKVGDSGRGSILGRSCIARIMSIGQSSVYPIVQEILGDVIQVQVTYLIIGGD